MEKTTSEQCDSAREKDRKICREIPAIVEQLVQSCNGENALAHVDSEPLPSKASIIEITRIACQLLYPGYFSHGRINRVNLVYYYGQTITLFFEMLAEQLALALRYECRRRSMTCVSCDEQGKEIAMQFTKELPRLRTVLAKDVQAAFEGDPAAKSYDEIIFSYPGLFAVTVHRLAHQLYRQNVPLIPRIMSEYAHGETGIDIHPGATIGESFFIDHGTGVVIGETTIIGTRVRIYQGVTLGALSLSKNEVEKLRSEKRHPNIEDDVVVYSGATILGGQTVIGARSVIGGNVWLTESVPPDTKVFIKKPELIYK
ncbi:MAG TPA: serine O-acetyltransferase EpsC [Dissulfurispiraceae bacterium]|nr:serine O-acetyltransferase EpsC [Dissulfurispiraceae bacterium]